MFTDKGPLGERVFLSADVARLAGISLRQLQWWDERKLVSPRQEGHRRVYDKMEMNEAGRQVDVLLAVRDRSICLPLRDRRC